MIRKSLRLRYILKYVATTILLSGVTVAIAKRFMPPTIYTFWLIVGGPLMIYGAVVAAKQRIRQHDPEWGNPVARMFGILMVFYTVTVTVFPVVEKYLPSTIDALGRLESHSDEELSSTIGPNVIVDYETKLKLAEEDRLRARLDKLADKRKEGAFTAEDEKEEQTCLDEYQKTMDELAKLNDVANGQHPKAEGLSSPSTSSISSESVRVRPAAAPTATAPPAHNDLIHYGASSKDQIAVAVASERSDAVWVETFKSELRQSDPRIQANAFNMVQMNAHNLFRDIYDGDTVPLETSGALSHFRNVVLIQTTERCNPMTESGTAMISCTLGLRAKAFDRSGETVASTSAQIAGVGFSEDEALQVAAKKLAKEAKASVFEGLH